MNDERIQALKNVRSELPLSGDDFAAIRRSVLQQVEDSRPASFTANRLPRRTMDTVSPLRIAAAIAVALMAVAGFVAVQQGSRMVERGRSSSTPAAESRITETASDGTRTPESSAIAVETPAPAAASAIVADATVPGGTAAASSPGAVRRAHRAQRQAPAALATPAVERIELETSDPDIRIIWIQSQTTEEGSSSR